MALIGSLVEHQERKSLCWRKPKGGPVDVGDYLSGELVSSLDKSAGYEDCLASPRIEPAAFASQLLEAGCAVSSSLHGVVLAEASGIPAVYLDWENGEDRFKCDDDAGTGRMQWRCGNSVEEGLDGRQRLFRSRADPARPDGHLSL